MDCQAPQLYGIHNCHMDNFIKTNIPCLSPSPSPSVNTLVSTFFLSCVGRCRHFFFFFFLARIQKILVLETKGFKTLWTLWSDSVLLKYLFIYSSTESMLTSKVYTTADAFHSVMGFALVPLGGILTCRDLQYSFI